MMKKNLLKITALTSAALLVACSAEEENQETAVQTEQEQGQSQAQPDQEEDQPQSMAPEEVGYDIYPQTEYIDRASEIEQEIADQWDEGDYTFENPLTIQNPYEISPLTALSLFETDQPAQVTVSVKGDSPETTITHTIEEVNTSHQIPVLGLYPGRENQVVLTAEYGDGSTEETELTIETDPMSEEFYTIDTIASEPENMADGLTYMIPSRGELFAVDAAGDVRFYFTPWIQNNFEVLDNGNLLVNMRTVISEDEPYEEPYNLIAELNHLGKPANAYWFEQDNYDGAGALHHDIIELEDNNWMVLAYDGSGEYIEDEMFEMDNETGEVVNNWNFKDIFPAVYYEEYDRLNADDGDWLHQNTVWLTDDGEHLLSSGRNQDMTIKTTYPENEIEWILTADENWPGGERPDDYLLEPIGDVKFPMGQHSPHDMPDLDNNPDTIDIMLFDNNRYVTRGHEELHEENSRATHYRINEVDMTVEEIWSYGEERETDYYSSIVGDANYMHENGTVLVNSGRVEEEEFPISYITEVTYDDEKEEVFEVAITEYDSDYSNRSQIYRAERHPLYIEGQTYNIELE